MRLSQRIVAKLKEKQAATVVTSVAQVTFQDQIVLSSQTDPISGLAMLIGKTKSGNFSYVLTTEEGSFKFFSTEELDNLVLEDRVFGEQVLPDGKKLLWLN
jgi:hypothetical protein